MEKIRQTQIKLRFIIGGVCLLPFMEGHNKMPGRIPANKLIGEAAGCLFIFIAVIPAQVPVKRKGRT